MRYLITFTFSILVGLATAQIGPGGAGEITGPSTADVGDVDTYKITGDFESPSWTVSSGASTNTNVICIGADACVRITWNTAGTKTISFRDNGVVIKTKTVTVYAPPPATPSATTTTNAGCQSTTITRTNNPPSGVRWYWQTSPTGTSTSLGYGTSITRTVQGPIYLRARSATITYNWSNSSQTISYPYNAFFPAQASGSNVSRCGTGSVTLNATPGNGGNTIRWYTSSSGGSPVHTGTSYTKSNLSSTTTYYAASYSTSTTCEAQTRKAITATINPIPGNATGTSATRCGSGTVTLSASPGSNGNSIRWYAASSGGSVLHTGTSFTTPTISSNTTYYAASYHMSTGCQSGYRRPVTAYVDTPSNAGTLTGATEEFGVASGVVTLGGTIVGNVVKWQYRTTGDWMDISNTTSTHSYTNVQETTEYRAIVKNGVCGEVPSNSVQITILVVPSVDLGVSQELRPGSATTLTATAGHYNYRWLKNNVEVQNGTDNQLEVDDPGNYKVEVTSTGGAVYTTGNVVIGSQLEFDKNAVLTYTYRTATQDNSDPFAFDPNQQTISAKIYDGLGRTAQQISLNGSPQMEDLVVPIEYDAFGRQTKSYLPYVADVNAIHKANALAANYNLSDHRDYYVNTSSHASDKAFAEVSFEASPLNRTLEQGSPGTQWQLGQNTVTFNYDAASATEVIDWDYSNLMTTSKTLFASGELSKTGITDEDGNVTEEYVNKQGQTILKKSQVDGSTWAETYYIYDVYGQLAVVLPPEATSRLDAEFFGQSAASKDAFLNTWAFLYDYDGRNRMTMKKVPGADSVFMIYDQWDRLVLTQDGVQRANNQWLFTKYDQLNRPIITGIMTGGTEAAERSAVAGSTVRFDTLNTALTNEYSNQSYPTSGIDNYLTVTYYDNYDWDNSGLAFTNPTGLTMDSMVRGQVTGTLTKTGNGAWIKSASYYDDRYRVIQTQSTNHLGGTDIVTNYYDFIGQVTQSISTHSSNTASHTITRSFTYDHAGRLLETWHQLDDGPEVLLARNDYNELGELIEKDLHINGDGFIHFDSLQISEYHGNDLTPNNWSVEGKTLSLGRGNVWKKYPLNYTITANTVLEFEYKSDHEGEIHGIGMDNDNVLGHNGAFQFHGTQSTGFTIDNYTYTAGTGWKKFSIPIGQHMSGQKNYITFFVDDDAGSDSDAIFKNVRLYEEGESEQSLDYTYNIRGWLTSINESDLSGADDDLFGMELLYDTQDGTLNNTQLYNGNISAMKWSDPVGPGSNNSRAYNYSYDKLNRLTDATHFVNGSSNADNPFDVSVPDYDLNGNIKALKRRAQSTTAYMDDLSYTYAGNQLQKVSDAASDTTGFYDGYTGAIDYMYDANGNMVKDRNKFIDSIYYNHLNLPTTVILSNSEGSQDSIKYLYDAAGIKLQQQVWRDDTLRKTTDYVGEFIYEDGVLELMQHEEGRVVPVTEKVAGDIVWTFDSDAEGFVAVQHIGSFQQNTPGHLEGTITGVDPIMRSPDNLNLDASKYDVIRIRFENNTSSTAAQMFFTTTTNTGESGTMLLAFPIDPNSGYTEYVLDMSSVSTWTGTIKRLRFDPVTGVTSGSFKLDQLIVEANTVLTAYDYQYHLKDHLGNVRMTFSTTPESYTMLETFETDEKNGWEDLHRTTNSNANTTAGGNEVESLTIGQTGAMLFLEVNKGDTLDLSVNANYESAPSGNTFAQTAYSSLFTAFDNSPFGTGEGSTVIKDEFGDALTGGDMIGKGDPTSAPRAFLNYIIFDKEMSYKTAGFQQISTAALGVGVHETISINDILPEQDGYILMYLSNENQEAVNIHWDDFTVYHGKTNVVSTQDYYPFGLTFNESVRVASTRNNFLFHNQTEFIRELKWYHFKYRMHDPAIGRFHVVDPLAHDYVYNSPYAFAENKLGRGIELEGAELLQFPWLGTGLALARPAPVARPVIENVVRVGKMNDHHVVPRAFRSNRVVQQARKSDFKFEGKENKIAVEQFSKSTGKGRHGNHPRYNKEVGSRLEKFKEFTEGKYTPEQAAQFLRNMIKDLKNTIGNNPDVKINDLFQMTMPADATSVDQTRVMTQEEIEANKAAAEQKRQEFERKKECENNPRCT